MSRARVHPEQQSSKIHTDTDTRVFFFAPHLWLALVNGLHGLERDCEWVVHVIVNVNRVHHVLLARLKNLLCLQQCTAATNKQTERDEQKKKKKKKKKKNKKKKTSSSPALGCIVTLVASSTLGPSSRRRRAKDAHVLKFLSL